MVIDRIQRLPWPGVRRHGLTVRWFERWTAVLDHALDQLPESTDCPHELFAALMRNPTRARKCAALVSSAGRPVAVIGLRKSGAFDWDVVGGGGVAASFIAAHVNGYLYPALSALGVNIRVEPQAEKPPESWVQRVAAYPVFRGALKGDFEAYWREAGHHKTVRQARTRTRAFHREVDGPGAAEWTIRSWAGHWVNRETASEDDCVLAAAYYARAGRFHTIRLMDGAVPVSGHTFLVEGDALVAHKTYTRPEYRQFNAGTRTLDMAFDWAGKAGFRYIELGTVHDYKRRWAPESGTRWSFAIRPWHMHAAAGLARRTVTAGHAIANAARRAVRMSPPARGLLA
jgi:GNAT superfamily N-acetyltransferase